MKICHLTSVHTPFDTRILYHECKSLSKAGYDVTLIAGHSHDEILEGINLIAIPVRKGKTKRMLLSPWDVYRKALTVDAAIYHFHDPELLLIGLLLKLLGKKVIYDVHEDYPTYIPSKLFIPRLLRRPIAWFIGFIEICTARFFDAIITVTPRIHERFEKLNHKTVMVRNYPSLGELSLDKKATPWEARTDSIAYIGLISVERGIREMIQALTIINRNRTVRLILGGKFDTEALEQEIHEMPEFSFIDYRGFMSREDVSCALSSVKAGIVIFLPERHHKDAYTNKLFEYMSAGIPVIASNFPHWRSIVEGGQCGLLVDPTKPHELAQAIDYIITHPHIAEEMGVRGRKLIEEQFNWEQQEKLLVDLYMHL